MFGIIIGVLCLVAFIGVWRGRFGRGCHGSLGGAYFGRGRRFARHRFGLYRAFEELDTSPGQEKAIRAAIGELETSARALRPSWEEARRSVASAFSGDAFDGDGLTRALETHLDAASRLTRAVVIALGKTHDALDPDQRRRLSRWVEALPHGHGF